MALANPTPIPEIVVIPSAAGLTPAPATMRPASLEAFRQTPKIEHLLRRMQTGDRAAAAEFLMRYESRIRRRIRGKIGSDVRRIFDSLDIVSTLGRRFDYYVMSGQLRAATADECLGLLFTIADHALIDKARVVAQLEEIEGEDSEFAHQMAMRLRDAERKRIGMHIEIEACMRLLADAQDKRILSLWLTGEPHSNIAEYVSLPVTAVRKRWQEIKKILRERLAPATA